MHVEVRPKQKKSEEELPTDRVREALKNHYQLDVERIERIAYGLWEESFFRLDKQSTLLCKTYLCKMALTNSLRGDAYLV
ncbi:hypothetical protein ACFVS2_05815 [Brevibacillus sp. NPDC058079]|uniref:hypothetical protein n=1 Tax=Brevibacillus sp. NPDC058079 TaxID=3346330 RepID=UPI0036E61F73